MFPPCPQPPDWSIDWGALDSLPWLQEMKGCPQNPQRHAEGDVWAHVHLVTEAMVALPAWRALPDRDRHILFAAALLHDVAKPDCTRVEPDGRISSRGHSWRGAVKARNVLWRRGVSFSEREAICAIVRHHLVPFFQPDSEDPRRLAIEVSQTARCDWLAIMAEADVRGRICPDPKKLLDQIARFRQHAEEIGCLASPYEFSCDEERFNFFREATRRSPETPSTKSTCEVVMLSGLPAAGKDYWLEQHLSDWPVVSLDSIRRDLGLVPPSGQAEVLSRAREMARECLQSQRGFAWNATNLSRNIRNECLRLFQEFNARVRLVYVEVSAPRLFAQNRLRRARVPEKVIERMLDRWEVPDRTEAHQIEYVVDERTDQPDAAR